jgi:hypothetical protein
VEGLDRGGGEWDGGGVGRGSGGGVGWGADWVAVHRLRPAEGGGQGSRR